MLQALRHGAEDMAQPSSTLESAPRLYDAHAAGPKGAVEAVQQQYTAEGGMACSAEKAPSIVPVKVHRKGQESSIVPVKQRKSRLSRLPKA